MAKENEKYEAELGKQPDPWQRFWTTLGAFGAGVGIGILLP
jgi:hypothetical protein